ncbi:ABC transporter, His/Glu/Gln/Arg/opine family (permease) [Campylobacter lari]|uniref:Pathogenesis-associated glutamine ABC transporter, permease protein n=1 Tax=Campylobacter lari NCTC 11845 TaxID=1388749 RepID=A0A0A8HUZ2_CAMLA|nr:amino acid ABC transporter permease [Campylobacter lari]AJD01642.1 pathogenesis-associated glutamine ABC transporter, permease protein [Campylobacter lari NCTC 11845]EAK0848168.1 amino acid ABC transporter permease [Campylobacter lari]EAK9955238.1 amino acid ABC transporter permease [Campylobacter lari]MCR6543306.1 amino acid ABC transporter permease [Campylobacter lari]STA74003.1 ABC transporter, His/Glu/Gln/Arg/opine family (permease) [Campylobacter lari]
MDFDFLIKFSPMFIQASWLTLKLATYGVFFSFLVGLFCVGVSYFKFSFLNTICKIYIEFSRNTPLLIQLFFLYYALPEFGIHLSSFACAVIGLSFLGGSYMAESLRAGMEAVKKQQYESGLSLGLSKWQNFRYVIMPQALGIAMPSISANIIFLLKETSVVSIIALADLVYVAKDLIGLYYKSNEALFALVLCYLILILPLSLVLNRIEKRLNYV